MFMNHSQCTRSSPETAMMLCMWGTLYLRRQFMYEPITFENVKNENKTWFLFIKSQLIWSVSQFSIGRHETRTKGWTCTTIRIISSADISLASKWKLHYMSEGVGTAHLCWHNGFLLLLPFHIHSSDYEWETVGEKERQSQYKNWLNIVVRTTIHCSSWICQQTKFHSKRKHTLIIFHRICIPIQYVLGGLRNAYVSHAERIRMLRLFLIPYFIINSIFVFRESSNIWEMRNDIMRYACMGLLSSELFKNWTELSADVKMKMKIIYKWQCANSVPFEFIHSILIAIIHTTHTHTDCITCYTTSHPQFIVSLCALALCSSKIILL